VPRYLADASVIDHCERVGHTMALSGLRTMNLPAPSRTFVDTVGLEWTVSEIATPELHGALARVLEHDRRKGGWLVFESQDGDKRRLAPYPPDWRTMTIFELERWCMRASTVPPAPSRRAQD